MRTAALSIQDQMNKEGLTDTYALVLGAKPQFHSAISIVQPAWAHGAEFFDADDPRRRPRGVLGRGTLRARRKTG